MNIFKRIWRRFFPKKYESFQEMMLDNMKGCNKAQLHPIGTVTKIEKIDDGTYSIEYIKENKKEK